MASSTATRSPEAVFARGEHSDRRRRISIEAGHALEILGHAIEYLVDEYIPNTHDSTSDEGRALALKLLMARNREIYFECPVISGFRERCLLLVGLKRSA